MQSKASDIGALPYTAVFLYKLSDFHVLWPSILHSCILSYSNKLKSTKTNRDPEKNKLNNCFCSLS